MRKITLLLPLLLCLFKLETSTAQVVINELVASNSNGLLDEDNTYQDWVELYNAGPTSVNLNGYGLTDDPSAPYKWVLPNVTLAPGQYRIVFCSDKNRTNPANNLHTNWKISNEGETIVLTSPNGAYSNTAPPAALGANISWARIPNGTGSFTTGTPTPGASNVAYVNPGEVEPPSFSHESGFYTTSFNLTLSTNVPGGIIVYTLDGSEPSIDNLSGTTYSYKNSYPKEPEQPFGPLLYNTYTSLTYSDPITIVDRTSQPNKISMISSTYDFVPPYFPTTTNIFKATVVRAKVVQPGVGESKTVTKNYFVSSLGSARYTLPVISISLSEDELFDYENGIYVAGKTFDTWRQMNPFKVASSTIGNYDAKGIEVEREANMHYFVNGQPVLNQNLGIRIQGNYSRIYPMKSLNLYARNEYGDNDFSFPFFSDQPYQEYKRVVLKNNGSDMYNTVFRDPLVNELAKGLNTQTEAYQPVIAFLNGEYWGIMSLRERYDDKFFNRVYGIPEDEIDLLENDGWYVEEGSNDDYMDLFDWVEENTLATEENYNYIKTKIDPESFTDYFITNIFLQNKDWPGNNIIFWRRSLPAYNPDAPYGHDGRWRWAVHDVTSTFSDATSNTLAVATDPDGPEAPNPSWSTVWLRRLLENDEFKYNFITRFADLMNTYYSSSRIIQKIDEMAAVLAPEIVEMSLRWKAPYDLNDWIYFINREKTFSNQRPGYQREHIRQEFGIANNINVTVDVSSPTHGYVKVNTIDIKHGTPGILSQPYPWTGVYFSNIPVKLKAIALPGYVFSHWSGASTATTDEIIIDSASSFSVTAHFISADPQEVTEPIYFWMMNTSVPNDTPLTTLSSSFEIPADGVIEYTSCLPGYPYTNGDPMYRKGSMERRNSPTDINYMPEANYGIPYASSNMRGLQVTQPFKNGQAENMMVFNMSTVGYKDLKFSFAAKNENAADAIVVDYAVNAGASEWTTSGITSVIPLTSNYQRFEVDFSSIAAANDNGNFKVRLRFTGPNMTADNGDRVTFNNFAMTGVPMSLTYPTPNTFVTGTAITPLTPTITGDEDFSDFGITPALPAGLTLNPTTGVISGTPTTASPTTIYTVSASAGMVLATADLTITVNEAAPTNLSYTTPNTFVVGLAVSPLAPTVTANIASYTVSPALPAGLTLNPTTGIISGTPTTVTATATYTITASNAGGSTTFDVVITVNDVPPASLSYNSPNTYTVGSAITPLTPTISGGPATYSVSPALPGGLTLNTTTGVISGTPATITATATYTVTASNSGGTVDFGVVITVNDVAPSALSYNSPNIFTVGTAITPLTPTVTGNVTSYSISPALPSGLSFDTATGIISGTPATETATATYTVTATNSGGSTNFGVVIEVITNAPTNLTYNSPNAYTVGTTITPLTPSVTGSVTSYTVSPALPSGLAIDPVTGIISGTPLVVTPSATYTVTASNAGGSTSFDVVILIKDIPPGSLSYTSPNTFTVGTAITPLVPFIDGTADEFSVSPALPSGLTLNTTTGVISGTPATVTTTATYTVTASNTGGSVSFGIVITVNDVAPTVLSYNTPNVFTVGTAITPLEPTITGNIDSFSISPTLPNGLVFDTATGIISGTPATVTVTETYTVTATNSGGSITFGIDITVNDIPPFNLSYPTPNVFAEGVTIPPLVPAVDGNVDSYSISPSLPAGLMFNTTTGIISGTPTVETLTATYTITATNSGGSTTFDIEITVTDPAPSTLTYHSPNIFTVGETILPLLPSVVGDIDEFTVSPALPDGLVLNALSGVISGTPTTETATATYTVTATNSGGSIAFGIVITVNDVAPTALSYNTPNMFTVGQTISPLAPTVTGNVDSYNIVPSLPDGLSFDTTTGIISGTPVYETETETYTVTASNSGGSTTFDIDITVNDIAPSALSYNTPNAFTVGTAITPLQPTVTGNVDSYSVSPSLPAGLSIHPVTGIISGTPGLVTSIATYTVTASNSGGSTSFGVEITVNDPAPQMLLYDTPNILTVGVLIEPITPLVFGNIDLYTITPVLPDGLAFDTATGEISGIPTSVMPSTTYTVTASNSGGSISFDLEIIVNPPAPAALSYNTPNVFTVGSAITPLEPTVTGSVDSYSISPALPSGLIFDTTTGIISGTPAIETATATYTVTATNSGGSVSFGIVITVNDVAPASLSYNTPNVFTVGTAITPLEPTVTGNVDSYSISPALPDGLVFDTTTGIISGTPATETAPATYTVTATNSGGSVSFDVVITVNDVAPEGLSYNSPNVFTVGQPIVALTPTIDAEVDSYSISPELPDGLAFDTTTGIISGTPATETATASYTVTATNSGGSVSFDVVITVNDVAPTALSYNTPNVFTVGTAITPLEPTVTGNVDSYSISPALPDGLVFDTITGSISGTPATETAPATYTVTATNSGGSVSFGIMITVNDVAPTALSYNTPNVFTVGTAITPLEPTVTGNVDSYSISPALPDGLVFDTTTGIISGTPATETATATYTVTATNSGGSVSFGIVITVNDVAPTALSYNTPNIFTVGTAITPLEPTVTGNVDSYSISPALPDGLVFDTATGIISGTPATETAAATYTVTATNSGGSVSFGIVITVNDVAPTALSYNTPNIFTVGTAITPLEPVVTGNVDSYSISPALPDGLVFDTTTGIISGTPATETATATYTVTATNSGGSVSFGIVITVNDVAPTALSYSTPNVFTVGTAITPLEPVVTGNVDSYSISPALPDGLVFDTTTGIISGTPATETATATYTVTATNSGGSVSFGIVITVNDVAPTALSYNTPNVFTVGTAITPLEPVVTGNVDSYSISPALPDGLVFDTTTGIISGTPATETATATYTVTATNSGGSVSFGIVITVNDVAPTALSYNTPNVFTVGTAITPLEPTVTGNVDSYSISPALPDGLVFDTITGSISGTPATETATATYTVTATNTGGSVSFGIVITVNDVAPTALSYNTPNIFTVGTAITPLEPTVTGNVDSYSISPALPDGLAFDTTTGIISGTPATETATATYTVTATNTGGSVSFDVGITVNDVAPGGLSYNSPNVFTAGQPIVPLTPTIDAEVDSFSISPELPDGLVFDTTTGIISGTPATETATATYTVTATNSGGSVSFGIVITVNDVAPTALSYNTPNVFTVGTAITPLEPVVTGNVDSYSISPALPDGLVFDTTTGIISGTPATETATATYTVTATNSGGSVSFGIVITVNDVAPTALSYNTPNIFTVGTAITPLEPTVTGNVDSYSISPALPSGLVFDTTTGIISGTPATETATATYTVTATNSGGSVSFDVVIMVNDVAPGGLSYNSPNVFTVGQTIVPLTPTIDAEVDSYSISPVLPDGLTFDTTTGIISGTPATETATAAYTVTATNSGGSVSFDVVITVNTAAPANLQYPTPLVFTVGSTIEPVLPTVDGNVTSYTISPQLPQGLGFDSESGAIIGSPMEASPSTVYTVTASNASGSTSFQIDITVIDVAPEALSYPNPNVFTVGQEISPLLPTVTGFNLVFSIEPDLPAGLVFDPATGIISGTPAMEIATATYTVTATNSGGSVTFDVIITVDEELGIGDDTFPSVMIYPNPFEDVIRFVNLRGETKYTLFAVDGRKVQEGMVETSLDLGRLPAGTYLLNLQERDKVKVFKIIKK